MTNLRNEAPIAVYDSGLGGLSVVAALAERVPREDFVYLGDTARAPYGTRSSQTVRNYAHACARVLREQRAKMVVVACNTVSAVALEALSHELFYPVIGVIEPGLKAALAVSPRRRIGVIGTPGTVRSGAYPRVLTAIDPSAHVYVQPAPLLVPLVDEGWLDGDVPKLAVRRYLEPLAAQNVDSLLLGCTHYPLLGSMLMDELADLSGRPVPVIDSAHAVADAIAALIAEKHLATERDDPGQLRIIVTDQADDFDEAASRFLGRSVSRIPVTNLDL